jgi:hypothetical protein
VTSFLDYIPDWMELAFLLVTAPFLPRAAMKERSRLQERADRADATESEKKSARRRLRFHAIGLPIFLLVIALLIIDAAVRVFT